MRPPRSALAAVAATLLVGGCGAPSFEDSVPALAQPQTEQDRLPTGEADLAGIDADSTRYLGGTQVAEYWVGSDGDEICLAVSLRAAATTGASCAGADEFSRSGLTVSVGAGTATAAGLLVPEGFDPADAPAEGDWVSVNDNLLAPAGEGEAEAPAR